MFNQGLVQFGLNGEEGVRVVEEKFKIVYFINMGVWNRVFILGIQFSERGEENYLGEK